MFVDLCVSTSSKNDVACCIQILRLLRLVGHALFFFNERLLLSLLLKKSVCISVRLHYSLGDWREGGGVGDGWVYAYAVVSGLSNLL